MDTQSIGDRLKRARAVAREQAARLPNAVVYQLVLAHLDEIETALPLGHRAAFEASRPLGVLAVRELDDAEAQAAELRRLVFEIRDDLRTQAGLPYYA